MRRLVLALLAALVFTGCANDPGSPGLQVSPPDIEVDTPHLRKIKARIGTTANIEVREPGGIERSVGKARRIVDKRRETPAS